MRVLFDTSPAEFYPGGISVYTRQIARGQRAFAALGVTLLPSTLPAHLQPDGARGLRHKYRVAAWDMYYMNAVLPARARSAGADLIHAPGLRTPFRASVPLVATIYDVIPLIFPRLFRRRDVIVLSGYFRRIARAARVILTISEQSQHDIHTRLGVPRERIVVTYLAANSVFTPRSADQVRATCERLEINMPYVLCVGTIEPRKNLSRVMEAFAQLRMRGFSHHLVLVGSAGPLAAPILTAATRLGLDDSIHFTGFVADEDLAALYSGATAFVYPSLYEGFGLPPLEAMSCGCPVITSNCSSLPEVVGTAGLQVDPYDVPALTAAMERLITDPALADDLRHRGLERSRGFTWQRCIEQTAVAYAQALNMRHATPVTR
ncbi:MAG: glycosyltransferase family 4 protein [Chloroflexaceae bacterium]